MDPRAEEEFDRQSSQLLDEVGSLAVAAMLLMAAGWGVGVILAYAW